MDAAEYPDGHMSEDDDMGGAVSAVENSYMKRRLVESNALRLAAIERGEQPVIGVNRYTDGEPSPLTAGDGSILTVDATAEKEQIEGLKKWRESRDAAKVDAALKDLKAAAEEGKNIMEPSIACAHAGVTTGEWAETLRSVYGEYRAPTGVGGASSQSADAMAEIRARVDKLENVLGTRLKMLVGKPGLDGHSNGAEQIAVRARDCGMEVVYEGIRLTPAQIVNAAIEEDVHVIGLSILSGSHLALVRDVMDRLRAAGVDDIPVVVGGIIPDEDAASLKAMGVAAVYTPKDFQLTDIMADVVNIVAAGTEKAA